ncbi:MAG: hypothetical protein ACTSXC_01845, partial [Candidatus Freyarchaeota archaeon]
MKNNTKNTKPINSLHDLLQIQNFSIFRKLNAKTENFIIPNTTISQHITCYIYDISSIFKNNGNLTPHLLSLSININKTKQNKTKQNKTKQNKTKQNKTKQNKTKQNKTKQNK